MIGVALPPFELDHPLVTRHRAQEKIIEKRRSEPNDITNSEVLRLAGLADPVKEGGKILGVRPRRDIVVKGMGAPDTSAKARIVEMINNPAGYRVKYIMRDALRRSPSPGRLSYPLILLRYARSQELRG